MILACLIVSSLNLILLLAAGVKGFLVYRRWNRKRQNAKSSLQTLAAMAAKRKQTKGA